jgi:hypothetical protein
MADAKVIDIEEFKGSRMRTVRFHTIAHVAHSRIVVDIQGEFSPAAARILAKHLIERADAAEAEAESRK